MSRRMSGVGTSQTEPAIRWCVWCHDRIEDGGERYLCARCARYAEMLGHRPVAMPVDDD